MDNNVGTEALSTGEVKARIQHINETIKRAGTTAGPFQKDGGLVTLSLDFDAYFASLDIEKCADIARDTIEHSNVSVKCNNEELSLFIACSHSVKEIEQAGLKDVVHKRRFKHSMVPGQE